MSYKVTIKQGDLLQERADFIVNPSNTRFLLGSGVSMAFKRACGIVLEQEMQQALKQFGGKVTQGDVLVTSSAKATNFTYALHVAVMNYNRGVRGDEKKPTLQTIQIALENIERILQHFYKKTQKTPILAIPLMGCGVGGLAKKEVINLYKQFFQKEIEFTCNVMVYGYTAEDYKLIRNIYSI